MKKLALSILLIAPVFFGHPEGYKLLGGWCTPEGITVFSLEAVWKELKKKHPKADALINFTFTPLKRDFVRPIYCGDVAVKESK